MNLEKIKRGLAKMTYIFAIEKDLISVGVDKQLIKRVVKLAKLSTEEAFYLAYKTVKKIDMYKFTMLLHKIKANKNLIQI